MIVNESGHNYVKCSFHTGDVSLGNFPNVLIDSVKGIQTALDLYIDPRDKHLYVRWLF